MPSICLAIDESYITFAIVKNEVFGYKNRRKSKDTYFNTLTKMCFFFFFYLFFMSFF